MAKDIYFHDDYGRLYEEIEGGESKIFTFNSNEGEIKHQFIIRKIPITIDGEEFYDIITPYGYGGPIITKSSGQENKLVAEFAHAFEEYCHQHNIVSEFVRFHPVIGNHQHFQELYQGKAIRKTLGTNLSAFENPVESEFSKSTKRNIKQALKKGINYRVTEKPTSLTSFKEIYYSTMDRISADEFYYFNNEYFENILKCFKDNTILVEAIFSGEVVAAELYFVYNGYIHLHLSGTLPEFLHLSPTYILRYGVTIWGKEKGLSLIHHGGGRGNSEEDSLYRFKKRFANHTEFDFYIGKKIWNTEIYNKLVELHKSETSSQLDDDFFPLYRGSGR